jgi:hypothetical protein
MALLFIIDLPWFDFEQSIWILKDFNIKMKKKSYHRYRAQMCRLTWFLCLCQMLIFFCSSRWRVNWNIARLFSTICCRVPIINYFSLVECPAGSQLVDGATECTECPEDMYRRTGMMTCSFCPPNFVSDTGSTDITDCKRKYTSFDIPNV